MYSEAAEPYDYPPSTASRLQVVQPMSERELEVSELRTALLQAIQLGGLQLAPVPDFVYSGALDQYVPAKLECPELLAFMNSLSLHLSEKAQD